MVAQTNMVSNSKTTSSRGSNSAASIGETAQTAAIRDLPSASGSAKSSRLEAEERAEERAPCSQEKSTFPRQKHSFYPENKTGY
jgi:hypothetical protein